MDTNHHSEDLNELERRLSAWQPDSEGLDADALLFAAGRASVRPSKLRLAWPALTMCLAGLAIVLGVCLKAEHGERLALIRQMRQPPPAPPATPAFASGVSPAPSEDVSPSGILATHRALERGLDDWPEQAMVRAETPAVPLPSSPILHVGQRDLLLDP
jgi:hypothetical protein